MIKNASDEDKVYGDGKQLVDNEEFPITHDFSDQLYMRKMKMKKGSLVVSTYHNTDHFWFLLEGRIQVNTGGEIIEHIAPCYEKSIKGAKRLIICLEDCMFINVHKNPTNTESLEEIEKNLYSFNIEEYNKAIKNK
jgi:hypothetical protein|tara:strand:+ start:140 stop:547 length:408 start_codon:yes stop_codon:yes gene_type:complete